MSSIKISKVIHIFSDNLSLDIDLPEGWVGKLHIKTEIEATLKNIDDQDGTDYMSKFVLCKEEQKEEFYKYVILYYYGGIFARYEDGKELNDKFCDIQKLTLYLEKRQISFFQCPSLISVGYIHHPQLITMILDTPFVSFSKLYKKINDNISHKTLITSLPLQSYLEKIKGDLNTDKTIIYSVGSFITGVLSGFLYKYLTDKT